VIAGSQTNKVAQEQAILDTAYQARLRLTERINNEQASDVLAGQPPLSANISALNSESTPKTIPPLHISALSNMTSTESADTDMLDMSPKATSATSTNLKTIPSWMTDARKRFESVFTAANEKSIVELWLEFEELLGYPDDRKIRLTKDMRPQQLSDWMQRHRLWDKAPPVDKASEFGATWKAWWKTLQPEWRIPDDDAHPWPLVRDLPQNERWQKLVKGGRNGFVLVLLSLTWWMMREKDESRKTVESSSAFADVHWALEQMIQVLRAQHEQGREGEDEREDEEDPNTRPKKR
jgi:hypothetical protein